MFGVIKSFIPNNYLNDIKNETKFSQGEINIDGKLIKEERLTVWMSDLSYEYKYGGKIMKPNKLSKSVKEIQEIIKKNYGVYYESVLINYYKDGNVGMRYHSDETYNEWNEDTVVVSFGAERRLAFREKNNYENKCYFDISSGDIIYIKDKNISNDRISLVFKKHL